ncbi:hypothetical protein NM688_g520 [Phlebia brevispora]|uniref:Uncharacterized protein n=1 Tax=Phlebia brevispora TaxID=194682 RepID=A0ACC1TE03_9APHY|nr:hypothetical protein NM688_g520 [Phlebia brevispora]
MSNGTAGQQAAIAMFTESIQRRLRLVISCAAHPARRKKPKQKERSSARTSFATQRRVWSFERSGIPGKSRYQQRKRIYYDVLALRLSRLTLKDKRTYVLPFSEPYDKAGYAMHSITNDLISDIYADFCKRTRQPESEMYLQTLAGIVMSMDATFKVAKKVAVVDKVKRHKDLMKGGVLSMINESNKIIAWHYVPKVLLDTYSLCSSDPPEPRSTTSARLLGKAQPISKVEADALHNPSRPRTSVLSPRSGTPPNVRALTAYHLQHPVPEYLENVREQQRLMLFRLTQAMSLHQVLAEPMVMSHLMGWSDVKRSHRYTPLFWSAFTSVLVACFPDLIDVGCDRWSGSTGTDRANDAPGNESGEHGAQEEEDTDLVTLHTRGDGRIYARSQISDYVCRGTELDKYSVLQFFKDTYEEYGSRPSPLPETRPESQTVDLTLHEDEDEEDDDDLHHRCSRCRNIRSRYTSTHSEADVKQRVVRSPNHRNLLKFIGRWFPSSDNPTEHNFYCASALMLFKPWRNIRTDLKPEGLNWSAAFGEYFSNASEQMKRMLGGLQYFHECKSAAVTSEEEIVPLDDFVQRSIRGDGEFEDEDDEDVEMDDEGSTDGHAMEYDENALKALLSTVVPECELQHAELAVAHAKSAKIFGHDLAHWDVLPTTRTSNATMDDLQRLLRWKEQLAKDVDKQDAIFAESQRSDGHQDNMEGRPPTIELYMDDDVFEGNANAGDSAASVIPGRLFCESLDPAQVFDLRADQFRTFDIVRWHLDQTLKGLDLPPLRMIIYGEGSTGKSKVIQTITAEFQRRGVRHLLVKAAYTGVAASLIDGKTCNVIAAIPVGGNTERMSQRMKDGLETFWKPRYYLIIDEYSMLGKTFLRLMSNRISIAKLGSGSTDSDNFFGGMSVILCGDLHQFPLVANRPSEYLFHPNDLVRDSDHSKLRRKIYESFETVVILKEQMRVVDPVWNDMLHHLCKGEMQQSDIDMLHSLVLKPGSPDVDFSKPPWNSATLVTPRHAVRKLWNHIALRKYCKEHGEQLLVVDAEDSVQYRGNRREPTAAEKYAIALRLKTKGARPNRDLPRTLELAKGMEVMVTENLQTDLDITNGARGTIVDIVLDPREPPIGDANEVHLQYLPAYILVKMRKTRASCLEDLDEGVIPLQPIDMTMRIKIRSRDHNHSVLTRTVHRRQYVLVAVYAYTDYRAQGQTLLVVLVDIAQPPTGRLTLFNLYVALSRSSGRQTIRLLGDFNDVMFLQAHNPDLLLEDERLQRLDEKTYEA